MRFSAVTLVVSVAAAAMLAAIASATPPSVTSTKGTVVVMRGNSVIKLSSGDSVLKGDRVLTTSGGAATFSNGAYVGSSSMAFAKNGAGDFEVTSKSRESSNSKDSKDSKSSNLFKTSSRDEKNGRNDDDWNDNKGKGGKDGKGGKGGDDWDDDDRNDDKPWCGNPDDPDYISN